MSGSCAVDPHSDKSDKSSQVVTPGSLPKIQTPEDSGTGNAASGNSVAHRPSEDQEPMISPENAFGGARQPTAGDPARKNL